MQLYHLSISWDTVLERWCTGAPHPKIEGGVPPRPRAVVTVYRQVVLLATKTAGNAHKYTLINIFHCISTHTYMRVLYFIYRIFTVERSFSHMTTLFTSDVY